MRLSAFPLLLAGASLVQYATASPLRVVVVTSAQEVSTNVHWDNHAPIVAPFVRPFSHLPEVIESQPGAGRKHLCSKMKDKALAITNKFRETFGLPLIAPEPHYDGSHSRIETLPIEFIHPRPLPADNGVVHVAGNRGMGHARHHNAPFLHRVHRALMVLGPWEGRAVAFVLGCGIGVLLRMVWVMAILFARAFSSSRRSDDEDVHDVLVFEADAEDILVPPPQYTDEKAPLPPVEEKTDVKA